MDHKEKANILILGGGHQQLPLIKIAKNKGYKVFLSDYTNDNLGKKLADDSKKISTFSVADNIDYAQKSRINFIMTNGTDQPVFTAAAVSHKLKLSHPISKKQSLYVTNKKYMKKFFKKHKIASTDYVITSKEINKKRLNRLKFPLVIKPVDSQGQRGIFTIYESDSLKKVNEKIMTSKQYSRTGNVVIEEFYEGTEITANCWIKNGTLYNIMLNDRLHFDDSLILGLCKQHRFPSLSINTPNKEKEIINMIQVFVNKLKLKDGPLYVQFLHGLEGPKIIELGYRIGGGFESFFIPYMTNFNIVECFFDLVTQSKNNFTAEFLQNKKLFGSINFLFLKPGTVNSIQLPANFFGEVFVKPGEQIGPIKNATSRVGFFIVKGESKEEYSRNLKSVDNNIKILDINKNDLIYHGIYE